MEGEGRKTVLAETGKFMIDIAKLVFGGIILAGIMEHESMNPKMLYWIGGIVVLFCFIVGLIFIALSKKRK